MVRFPIYFVFFLPPFPSRVAFFDGHPFGLCVWRIELVLALGFLSLLYGVFLGPPPVLVVRLLPLLTSQSFFFFLSYLLFFWRVISRPPSKEYCFPAARRAFFFLMPLLSVSFVSVVG